MPRRTRDSRHPHPPLTVRHSRRIRRAVDTDVASALGESSDSDPPLGAPAAQAEQPVESPAKGLARRTRSKRGSDPVPGPAHTLGASGKLGASASQRSALLLLQLSSSGHTSTTNSTTRLSEVADTTEGQSTRRTQREPPLVAHTNAPTRGMPLGNSPRPSDASAGGGRGQGKRRPSRQTDSHVPGMTRGDGLAPSSPTTTTSTAVVGQAGPGRDFGESPGTVTGSYVNENLRLVVSEPQYSPREWDNVRQGLANRTSSSTLWLEGSPTRVRTPPGSGPRGRHGSDGARRAGQPFQLLRRDGSPLPPTTLPPHPADVSDVSSGVGHAPAPDSHGSPPPPHPHPHKPQPQPQPQHPSSSPPLGLFVRHPVRNAGPRRMAGGSPQVPPPSSAVNTPFTALTPPPTGALRAPVSERSPAMLTPTPRAPASTPASAISPRHLAGGRPPGVLSSLSPRRQQQQQQQLLMGRGPGRYQPGSAPLPSLDNTTSPAGLTAHAGGLTEEFFGGTRLLSSIRELTKRRLSDDLAGGMGFPRTGESALDGTRAFALGGSSGGGGASLVNGNGAGAYTTTSTSAAAAAVAELGLSHSPRPQVPRGRGWGGAVGGPSVSVKLKGKRNPFSLHAGSGGESAGAGNGVRGFRGITPRESRLSAEGVLATLMRSRSERESAREDVDKGMGADGDSDNDDEPFRSGAPAAPAMSVSPPPPRGVRPASPSPRCSGAGGTATAAAAAAVGSSSTPPPSPAYDFRVLLSSGTTSTKPIVLACGSGCVQGMRSTMEDEHFISLNATTVRGQPVSLVGVLDGHCGRRVATLGKTYLPHYFFKHSGLGDNNALAMVESIVQSDREIFYELHRPKPPRRGGGRSGGRGRTGGGRARSTSIDIFETTHNASDELEEELEEFASGGVVGGGSTLIAAAVHGRMLYVACLGDARAVLLDGRTTVAMSEDHKPQNVSEGKRIARCGGFVQFGRVCGVLAVSRALGDYEFKFSSDAFGSGDSSGGEALPWEAPRQANQRSSSGSSSTGASRFHMGKELMVSNVADVKQLNLTDASRFLVLACDGLWDVLENEEVTQFVRDFFMYIPAINDPLILSGEKPRPSPAAIKRALDSCSLKLAEFAVDRGSTDNVSVMILFFHDVVSTVVEFSRGMGGSSSAAAAGGATSAGGLSTGIIPGLGTAAGRAVGKKQKKRKPAV